eukprot:1202572-Amphidinium_carterae.1
MTTPEIRWGMKCKVLSMLCELLCKVSGRGKDFSCTGWMERREGAELEAIIGGLRSQPGGERLSPDEASNGTDIHCES